MVINNHFSTTDNKLLIFFKYVDFALSASAFDKNSTCGFESALNTVCVHRVAMLNVKPTSGETDITDKHCLCYVCTKWDRE